MRMMLSRVRLRRRRGMAGDACWPTHADRVALRHGYDDDTLITDACMAACRAALGFGDMAALAPRPAARPQALERWHDLRMTFTYVPCRS